MLVPNSDQGKGKNKIDSERNERKIKREQRARIVEKSTYRRKEIWMRFVDFFRPKAWIIIAMF